MKTISKRELNHQTAQVLAAIQAGEAVLVTERGVPRWRIEAVDASADPVERLRAQGRIRPASPNPPPWPKGRYSPTERRAQYTPADVDALYEDMREEIGRAHVELQSLMRMSYAVFCLKKKQTNTV